MGEVETVGDQATSESASCANLDDIAVPSVVCDGRESLGTRWFPR